MLATTIAGGVVLFGLAHPIAAQAAGPRPLFQLPFQCGEKWQLNSYGSAHAPALDMVREPDQHGTNGALLIAPAAGRVNQSFWHQHADGTGAGNVIQIDHGGGWFTTYIHLQSRSVSAGNQVVQGQEIGRVGATGSTSNGHPHLHYELAIDANGNGSATWGYAGSERVPAWFNNVQYGGAINQNYRDVTSHNGCSNPPPAPPPSGTRWVDTFANAPGAVTPGGIQTGTLYAGRNYVYCRQWGPEVRVGSAYNHWWLKTDLDTGNPWQKQWVSAYYLAGQGNDVAKDIAGLDIPVCQHRVDTFANAPGHSTPGGAQTGTLYQGTNYVYCRRWGPEVRVGSAYNHWWLKTDLDTGNPWQNQWVSAYYLSRWGNDEAKDNDGLDIPICW